MSDPKLDAIVGRYDTHRAVAEACIGGMSPRRQEVVDRIAAAILNTRARHWGIQEHADILDKMASWAPGVLADAMDEARAVYEALWP